MFRNLKKSLIKKNIFRFILISFGIILLFGSIFTFFYIKDIDSKLPDPERLVNRNLPESTIIYDRNGVELYRFFGKENRELVKIGDVPDNIKSALIASEDSEYYTHEGYNILSTVKCLGVTLINKVTGKTGTCGGSTITQQLVRNTILFDEFGSDAYERSNILKSVDRKVKEILSAYRVENKYSKDEILQMYINEVPLGSVNYGLQTASIAYFGKNLKDLTLSESATLVGFIQSPSYLNPVISGDFERYKSRREYVLNQLLRYKERYNITEEEINKAKEEIITFKSKQFPIKAPHFVMYIKPEIEKLYGTDFSNKGLRIYTTIDYSLQKIAEDNVKKMVDNISPRLYIFNGGVLALSPKTNQILAMVGSSDYWRETNEVSGNVNTLERRILMGSSVKPYTYLTAFDKGYGPWLLAPDIPGIYDSANLGSEYTGLVSANTALIYSGNVSTMYVQELVEKNEVINTYKKLDISNTEEINDELIYLSLGNFLMSMIEHTNAFNVFPSEGKKAPLTSILNVTDINGNILLDNSKLEQNEYYSNETTYQMNWILCRDGSPKDDLQFMIGGEKVLCGKTGTSGIERNLISMYYHKNLMLGAWLGNTDGTEISKSIYSTYVTSPLAKSIIEEAKTLYKPEKFTRPDTIKAGILCTETGRLKGTTSVCTSEKTIYLDGSKITQDIGNYITVCKDTGTHPVHSVMSSPEYIDMKYFINKSLELTAKQSVYDNYVKNKYKNTINIEPIDKDCPLKNGDYLGSDGASLFSPYHKITKPNSTDLYSYDIPILFEFTIYKTPSVDLSRFKITVDGIVPGEEINIFEGDHIIGSISKYIKFSDYFDYKKYWSNTFSITRPLKIYLYNNKTNTWIYQYNNDKISIMAPK